MVDLYKEKDGWEITLKEFKDETGVIYKVTRRYPEQYIAETKTYKTRIRALAKFKEWSE